jgi:hypothetical protein
MLAGSGAPPPEENQLKENITSYSKPQSRGPAYWPLISADAFMESPIGNAKSAWRLESRDLLLAEDRRREGRLWF